ncbi:MAG: HDOD domain-containing protein [Planctomycetota bacterium]
MRQGVPTKLRAPNRRVGESAIEYMRRVVASRGSSAVDVARAVALLPSLERRVIQAANGTLIGRRCPTQSLTDAIVWLGFDGVLRVAAETPVARTAPEWVLTCAHLAQ